MMKKILWIGIYLMFLSCQRHESPREDRLAPWIEIIEPKNPEITAGDTLKIQVRIEDNDQLHDVYLGLNDLNIMLKRIHWSQHYHGQMISLDTCFVTSTSESTGHYQIQIEASDHSGNRASKRIGIFVKEN